MKKITNAKMLGLSLVSTLMLVSNIKVQAVISTPNLDFNNNGVVDTQDISILATNYNLKSGDSKWDSKYDLNSDNVVDIFDLAKESKASIPDNTDITSKFTDLYFKAAVYKLIGKTSPAPILYSDVKNKTQLNLIPGAHDLSCLSNLSGIEYFTALTHLACYSNGLRTLDLSKNTALTYLDCAGNNLTTLDLSDNTALTTLYCYYNQLATLYSTKEWDISNYKYQFTDETRTNGNITDSLVITVKS